MEVIMPNDIILPDNTFINNSNDVSLNKMLERQLLSRYNDFIRLWEIEKRLKTGDYSTMPLGIDGTIKDRNHVVNLLDSYDYIHRNDFAYPSGYRIRNASDLENPKSSTGITTDISTGRLVSLNPMGSHEITVSGRTPEWMKNARDKALKLKILADWNRRASGAVTEVYPEAVVAGLGRLGAKGAYEGFKLLGRSAANILNKVGKGLTPSLYSVFGTGPYTTVLGGEGASLGGALIDNGLLSLYTTGILLNIYNNGLNIENGSNLLLSSIPFLSIMTPTNLLNYVNSATNLKRLVSLNKSKFKDDAYARIMNELNLLGIGRVTNSSRPYSTYGEMNNYYKKIFDEIRNTIGDSVGMHNFEYNTAGTWNAIDEHMWNLAKNHQRLNPDKVFHVVSKSGSEYIIDGNNIYRSADHWGDIGLTYDGKRYMRKWPLLGSQYDNDAKVRLYGQINLNDLKRIEGSESSDGGMKLIDEIEAAMRNLGSADLLLRFKRRRIGLYKNGGAFVNGVNVLDSTPSLYKTIKKRIKMHETGAKFDWKGAANVGLNALSNILKSNYLNKGINLLIKQNEALAKALLNWAKVLGLNLAKQVVLMFKQYLDQAFLNGKSSEQNSDIVNSYLLNKLANDYASTAINNSKEWLKLLNAELALLKKDNQNVAIADSMNQAINFGLNYLSSKLGSTTTFNFEKPEFNAPTASLTYNKFKNPYSLSFDISQPQLTYWGQYGL